MRTPQGALDMSERKKNHCRLTRIFKINTKTYKNKLNMSISKIPKTKICEKRINLAKNIKRVIEFMY